MSAKGNTVGQPWRRVTAAHSGLANESVKINIAGQVVLKLKAAWHDDTTGPALAAMPDQYIDLWLVTDADDRRRPTLLLFTSLSR